MNHENAKKHVENLRSTQQPLWAYLDVNKDIERCADLLQVKRELMFNAIEDVTALPIFMPPEEYSDFVQRFLLVLEYLNAAKEEK